MREDDFLYFLTPSKIKFPISISYQLSVISSAVSQTAKTLGNRDRGTTTEYLRGLCFEYLVKSRFNVAAAARELAGSSSVPAIERVTARMNEYLHKVRALPPIIDETNLDSLPLFKGLPKKFHAALSQVIENRNKIT